MLSPCAAAPLRRGMHACITSRPRHRTLGQIRSGTCNGAAAELPSPFTWGWHAYGCLLPAHRRADHIKLAAFWHARLQCLLVNSARCQAAHALQRHSTVPDQERYAGGTYAWSRYNPGDIIPGSPGPLHSRAARTALADPVISIGRTCKRVQHAHMASCATFANVGAIRLCQSMRCACQRGELSLACDPHSYHLPISKPTVRGPLPLTSGHTSGHTGCRGSYRATRPDHPTRGRSPQNQEPAAHVQPWPVGRSGGEAAPPECMDCGPCTSPKRRGVTHQGWVWGRFEFVQRGVRGLSPRYGLCLFLSRQ